MEALYTHHCITHAALKPGLFSPGRGAEFWPIASISLFFPSSEPILLTVEDEGLKAQVVDGSATLARMVSNRMFLFRKMLLHFRLLFANFATISFRRSVIFLPAST